MPHTHTEEPNIFENLISSKERECKVKQMHRLWTHTIWKHSFVYIYYNNPYKSCCTAWDFHRNSTFADSNLKKLWTYGGCCFVANPLSVLKQTNLWKRCFLQPRSLPSTVKFFFKFLLAKKTFDPCTKDYIFTFWEYQ